MDVPGRIPRERGARERFARAVDQGASHLDDQEFADELAVVSALRSAGAEGAPDSRTRERIAARISEPEPASRVTTLKPVGTSGTGLAEDAEVTVPRPRSPEPERERPKPRLAAMVAAAFCLVLALAGIGTTMSSDSLPGDLLYQVKRAQESASLTLTLDEGDRARKRLEYAGYRLVELARLADRAEPGTDYDGFRVALADFGSDTRAGVAQLTTIATTSDGSQLTLLREWVRTQSDRLADLRVALPAEVAADRARTAILLQEVDARATALAGRMNCYQITSGESDELGVLPSQQECGTVPGNRAAGSATPSASAGPSSRDGDTSGTESPKDTDPAAPNATMVGSRTSPDEPATIPDSPETESVSVPANPAYVPRERLRAPAPTSVSRSRVPDSTPEPPAVVSVPPLSPEMPDVGIG
ncbi:DUF5667 domain-containing protein [Amycolatopsis palatopharyngis]|uniref:DUF5667 domain-containing protein n=1 Tax=Amycolatopsis palatopharyngis TaxID=187982 RepID=UPI000E22817B|nr:DUF5667 domain-containing protein [Amycolatopsis palatopharyngis]